MSLVSCSFEFWIFSFARLSRLCIFMNDRNCADLRPLNQSFCLEQCKRRPRQQFWRINQRWIQGNTEGRMARWTERISILTSAVKVEQTNFAAQFFFPRIFHHERQLSSSHLRNWYKLRLQCHVVMLGNLKACSLWTHFLEFGFIFSKNRV